MAHINFKTHTLLDIRAITTFGLNAKPNSKSPIGYFGTGLKMAIAVFARERIPVTLFIGTKIYQFSTQDTDFRGKEFHQVIMRRRDSLLAPWQTIELPFTTELAKNWELWMAFRELESNTRDEDGISSQGDDSSEGYIPKSMMSTNTTQFFVFGDAFQSIWNARNTVFLPGGLNRVSSSMDPIQIFTQPSNYIYYRGMRVVELERPSIFTYNILEEQPLTEDRTLKDQWYVPYQIANWLVKQTDKDLIHKLLTATEQNYEWELPLDSVSSIPSAEFLSVTQVRKSAEKPNRTPQYKPLAYSPRISTFVERHTPPIAPSGPSLATRFAKWFDDQKSQDLIQDTDYELLYEVVEALKEL